MPTEYGIRPYVNMVNDDNEETPYVDMMKAPTWAYALAQEVQKFSEFMKPYLADGDYPDMESNWPGYSFPQPDGGIDTGDYDPRVPGCIVTCNSPLYCDDPVKCHPSISQCPPGLGPAECRRNFQFEVRVNGRLYSDWTYFATALQTVVNPETGAVTYISKPGTSIDPLEIYAPINGWAESPDSDKVTVTMRDPAGNLCRTTETVFCRSVDCCTGPTYVPMTFDDTSTPDTVAPGGSISVYVLNGCPPYSWSVSGIGYSLGAASTAAPSNTLTSASGTCGTHYAAVATVTVTDKCSTVVTFKIRNTGGQYVLQTTCSLQESGSCVVNGSCTLAGYAGAASVTEDAEYFQYYTHNVAANYCTGGTCIWKLAGGSPCSFSPIYSPCTVAVDWGTLNCPPLGLQHVYSFWTQVIRYRWVC